MVIRLHFIGRLLMGMGINGVFVEISKVAFKKLNKIVQRMISSSTRELHPRPSQSHRINPNPHN